MQGKGSIVCDTNFVLRYPLSNARKRDTLLLTKTKEQDIAGTKKIGHDSKI